MPRAAPSIRSSCLQRILLGLRLSFHLPEEQRLVFNEQSRQWTCVNILQHLASSSQSPLVRHAQDLLFKTDDEHCCSSLLISVIFKLGKITSESLKNSQITSEQIPALTTEILWLFLTPWVGLSGLLPSFALPPVILPIFSPNARNESDVPPIVESTFEIIFWNLIAASILPLCAPVSDVPFIQGITATDFRSFIELREILQDILRAHLKSNKTFTNIYTSDWMTCEINGNQNLRNILNNLLSKVSGWTPLWESISIKSCDQDLIVQYYDLALHFLIIVADSNLMTLPVSKFSTWTNQIFFFPFNDNNSDKHSSDILNNRAVLKKFVLVAATYSSLICQFPATWNSCITTAVKSLMIGQYDDQYVSFRSKEDHAGAVAFMKLVTAAAARPGTIIGNILQQCFNSSNLLGSSDVAQILLFPSPPQQAYTALLSSEFPPHFIPMVPSSYPLIAASWGSLNRMVRQSSSMLELRPFFHSFIHCLAIFKDAVSQIAPDPQHEITSGRIIFLAQRIKLASRSAEAIIASAVDDRSSLVLSSIGIVGRVTDINKMDNEVDGMMILEYRSVLVDLIPFWSKYLKYNHSDVVISTLESLTSLISCAVRLGGISVQEMLDSFNSSALLPFWYRPLTRLNLTKNEFLILGNRVCIEAINSAHILLPSLYPSSSPVILDGLNALANFLQFIVTAENNIIQLNIQQDFQIVTNFFILHSYALRCTVCLGGVSLPSSQLVADLLKSIDSRLSNPVESSEVVDIITFFKSELTKDQLFQLLSYPSVFISAQTTPANQTTPAQSLFHSLNNGSSHLETDRINQLPPPRHPQWIDVLVASILQCLSSDVSLSAATATLVESLRLLLHIASSFDNKNVSRINDILEEAAWLTAIQCPVDSTPPTQWRWCMQNSQSRYHFIREVSDSQIKNSTVATQRSNLKTVLRKFCGQKRNLRDMKY